MDKLTNETRQAFSSSTMRYSNIQILRAVAAGLVVLVHSQHYLHQFVGPSALAGLFSSKLFGFYGVIIFFAISGFLMGDLVKRSDPWTFILHRVVRIYPPYYIAVAASVALLSFMPWQPEVDLLGLSLVPGFAPGTLGIEWTLVFETVFYVVLFALSIVGLAKWVDWFAAAWLGAILLTTMVAPGLQADINPPLSTLLLSSMNVAFAAGLLLPRLMRMVTFWPIALLIGIPLAFVVPADDWTTLRWTVSLTCVLLVGAAAQLPQITSERWLSRTAIRFGNWSYATYLIHCTVLWLWFQCFQGYAHPTRVWLFGLVLVAIATAALGWLDVKLYEKLRDVVKYASFDRKRIAGSIYVATFVLFCVLGVALV